MIRATLNPLTGHFTFELETVDQLVEIIQKATRKIEGIKLKTPEIAPPKTFNEELDELLKEDVPKNGQQSTAPDFEVALKEPVVKVKHLLDKSQEKAFPHVTKFQKEKARFFCDQFSAFKYSDIDVFKYPAYQSEFRNWCLQNLPVETRKGQRRHGQLLFIPYRITANGEREYAPVDAALQVNDR